MTLAPETLDRMIAVALGYPQDTPRRRGPWLVSMAMAASLAAFIVFSPSTPLGPRGPAEDITTLANDISDLVSYDVLEDASL